MLCKRSASMCSYCSACQRDMLGLTEKSNLGSCHDILNAEDVVAKSPARGFPARVTSGTTFLQSCLWWPIEVASSCSKASRNRLVYPLQAAKSNQTKHKG